MKTVFDAESPTIGVGSVRKRKVCVPGVERLGMSRRRVTTRRRERHEEEKQVEEQGGGRGGQARYGEGKEE